MLLTISVLAMATVVYIRVKTYHKNKAITHSTSNEKKHLPSVMSSSIYGEDESRMSDIQKEINQDLAISLSSLGLTIAGKYYLPLNLLSLPGLIYVYIPWFKDGYDSLVKERRIKMATIDMFFISGLLAAQLYFPASLVAVGLSLSKKLLFKAEDHAQKRLVNVFSEIPRSAWLLKDQIEIEVPFNTLKINDLVAVHAGEIVPIDGMITTGHAQIDQRILTGESQPVEKEQGDQVFALTIVLSGKIYIKVEKTGQDTVAAQIGDILNNAADFRHSVQWQWMKFIDKTAFPTLAIGVLTLPIIGFTRALGIVFSFGFGYAMRVIAPITLLTHLNLASKNSILIKDGRVLELLNQIDTIVFDKTGRKSVV